LSNALTTTLPSVATTSVMKATRCSAVKTVYC